MKRSAIFAETGLLQWYGSPVFSAKSHLNFTDPSKRTNRFFTKIFIIISNNSALT